MVKNEKLEKIVCKHEQLFFEVLKWQDRKMCEAGGVNSIRLIYYRLTKASGNSANAPYLKWNFIQYIGGMKGACEEPEICCGTRHWNLLENKCMPLIKILMRQRPQNLLERPCARASERVCSSQSITASALWLTNQVAAATSAYCPIRRVWGLFLCRLPASRFTRWFGVSLIPLSLALLYTYVLVTVNTQSLSSQRIPFRSLGA